MLFVPLLLEELIALLIEKLVYLMKFAKVVLVVVILAPYKNCVCVFTI